MNGYRNQIKRICENLFQRSNCTHAKKFQVFENLNKNNDTTWMKGKFSKKKSKKLNITGSTIWTRVEN